MVEGCCQGSLSSAFPLCRLGLCLFGRQTNSSKGSPPKQPIALALYECQVAERIPQFHLQRIIDARVGFFAYTLEAFISHSIVDIRAPFFDTYDSRLARRSCRVHLFNVPLRSPLPSGPLFQQRLRTCSVTPRCITYNYDLSPRLAFPRLEATNGDTCGDHCEARSPTGGCIPPWWRC